jgi:hypothetical protein
MRESPAFYGDFARFGSVSKRRKRQLRRESPESLQPTRQKLPFSGDFGWRLFSNSTAWQGRQRMARSLRPKFRASLKFRVVRVGALGQFANSKRTSLFVAVFRSRPIGEIAYSPQRSGRRMAPVIREQFLKKISYSQPGTPICLLVIQGTSHGGRSGSRIGECMQPFPWARQLQNAPVLQT